MKVASPSTTKALKACAWLLGIASALFGLAHLRFDVDVLNLLPPELPAVRGLKVYQSHFTDANELIIAVEAQDPDHAEEVARDLAVTLGAATNLVSGVQWQSPWLERPREGAELIAYLWFNAAPHHLQALAHRLSGPNLTNTLEGAIQTLATSLSPLDLATLGRDPFGLLTLPPSVGGGSLPALSHDGFASADGTLRLLFVEARSPLKTYKSCIEWLAQIRHLASPYSARVSIQYTGQPAFVSEISGSMERDLKGSSAGTLAVIAILFYLVHRRIMPLLLLLLCLLLTLAATVAVAGHVFGTINVVSLGFASILLGLVEDFGIVLYEERRMHPDLSCAQLRKLAGRGIGWSTLTASAAFLVLNLIGLPGLAQMGTLVAIGTVLGASLMLWGFLPLIHKLNLSVDKVDQARALSWTKPSKSRLAWATTGLLLLMSGVLLWIKGPAIDPSPEPLRPQRSEAYATLEKISRRLAPLEEPVWILVPGRDEGDVQVKLHAVESWLTNAQHQNEIKGFTLPISLWPHPANQNSNRPVVASIISQRASLWAAAANAGFTKEALQSTDFSLALWERAARADRVFWPSNETARSILKKLAAQAPDGLWTLGLLEPAGPSIPALPSELADAGVLISGWSILGKSVMAHVMKALPWVTALMLIVVAASLWIAFRRIIEVGLSFATIGLAVLALCASMAALGWQWNLFNLVALPLLLGLGVDYSIHMQLALQRSLSDANVIFSTRRALLLAGSTTIAGFAALSFSTSAGLASLGRVCALGIAWALFVAVFLLPAWWRATAGPKA